MLKTPKADVDRKVVSESERFENERQDLDAKEAKKAEEAEAELKTAEEFARLQADRTAHSRAYPPTGLSQVSVGV